MITGKRKDIIHKNDLSAITGAGLLNKSGETAHNRLNIAARYHNGNI